jgi:hypothetical protein
VGGLGARAAPLHDQQCAADGDQARAQQPAGADPDVLPVDAGGGRLVDRRRLDDDDLGRSRRRWRRCG